MKRSLRQGGSRRKEFPIRPILEALGGDVPPLRGGWTKMRCPFHKDTVPSASVNETGFVCHGCNIGGDAVSLLMAVEGLSGHSAIKRAEEITGISDRGIRAEHERAGLIPPGPRNHQGSSDSGQAGFRF